jgi:hypothetical protein
MGKFRSAAGGRGLADDDNRLKPPEGAWRARRRFSEEAKVKMGKIGSAGEGAADGHGNVTVGPPPGGRETGDRSRPITDHW